MNRRLTVFMAAVSIMAGCGSKGPGLHEQRVAGRKIYLNSICIQCHGMNREGSEKGPALLTVEQHWTAETLEAFLADPPAHMVNDARLLELASHYAETMPKFVMDDAGRAALAVYLLGPPDVPYEGSSSK